jgi:CheY-like chemotaxis protein
VTRPIQRISGGDAALVTYSDLPPPNTSRWVARRKAQVVDAIQLGRLSIEEACRLYRLTVEELAGWQRAFLRHGINGLKATHARLSPRVRGARPLDAPAALDGHEARHRRPGPLRLLVIDDEPMVARFILHAADAHGIESAMTISAEAFRRDYERQDPDVIVLDLAMPGGDGIELLRFLAERKSRAAVVVLSGFDPRVLDAAVRLGRSIGLNMAPPLAKPVTVDDLLGAIRAADVEPAR